MAVAYEITYHSKVVHEDIPQLAKIWQLKIKKAIEHKLTTHPEIYGKPLQHSLQGLRKLRVGDYRVVFEIRSQQVRVLAILHRSKVYAEIEKR